MAKYFQKFFSEIKGFKMASSTNHPIIPEVAIQASSNTGIPASAENKIEQGGINSTKAKINEVYHTADTEFINFDLEDYYMRGINLLKPEIVMSSEYVPIRKDFDDSPGLQIQAGNQKISVNQVFKLIELHHSVQKSVNIASLEFLNSAAGVNVNNLYNEASKYFSTDLLKSTLDETVDAYMDKLKSEIPTVGTQD